MTEKTHEQQIQEAALLYLASFFVLSDKASYSEENQKVAEDYFHRTKDFLSQNGYLPDQLEQSTPPLTKPNTNEAVFLFPDIIIASKNGKGIPVEGKKVNDFIELYFPRIPKDSVQRPLLSSLLKKH